VRYRWELYRLENCVPLRAPCKPNFLRSFMRASRVRYPESRSFFDQRMHGDGPIFQGLYWLTRSEQFSKRSGDALAGGSSVTTDSPATYVDKDIYFAEHFGYFERGENQLAIFELGKVAFHRAAVDFDPTGAIAYTNASDSRLATASAPIVSSVALFCGWSRHTRRTSRLHWQRLRLLRLMWMRRACINLQLGQLMPA